MKIIFGTDFSEKSMEAGQAAAELARRWGDLLAVAHVVEESSDRKMPREVSETMAAFTSDRLHSDASELASRGVIVEEHLLSGTPDMALAELAGQSDTRLIVISSLGHRPGEWLLGSVAAHTTELSPVPTLVVRSSAPFVAWARGERPLKIFVAFDYTDAAEKALHWVKHLQSLGPCEIVIGYVDWPLADESRLGIWASPFQHHNPPEVQGILERELRERAVKLLGEANVRLRCEPSMGRPDARLIEIASEEMADLVVTGTHQRRAISRLWRPSIARALLRYAPMSVLCVPVSHKERIPLPSAAIRRVLVAVDFSEQGGRAVPFAYGIVQAGGVVRLVHVAEPLEMPNPLIGGYPHPLLPTEAEHTEGLARAKREMKAMIPEDAAARGIVTEITVIESHDVAKAIRREGERCGAEVLCLGAHNRSGLARSVLGSVAQAVMADSRRPVLVVRDVPA